MQYLKFKKKIVKEMVKLKKIYIVNLKFLKIIEKKNTCKNSRKN